MQSLTSQPSVIPYHSSSGLLSLTLTALAWLLSTTLFAWLLTSVSTKKKTADRSFKGQHRRMFPDLYSHPGFLGADEDGKELLRRLAWLSTIFPDHTRQDLLVIAEAGFRGEFRAGFSLQMADPSFSRLHVLGPHPKYFAGRFDNKDALQAKLKMDMFDAFHAYSFGLDWAGVTFGMETIAPSPNSMDQTPSYSVICVQSRLFQQLCDEEVKMELQRFGAFLKNKVFDLALQQRSDRKRCYKDQLTNRLNCVNRGEMISSRRTPAMDASPGAIAALWPLAHGQSALSSTRTIHLKYSEDGEYVAAEVAEGLHPDCAKINEGHPPSTLNSADLLPPLGDSAWKSVAAGDGGHAMHAEQQASDGDKARTLVKLNPADVGLLLVFKFLGYDREQREILIKHVALWKQEEGADALVKMEKVAPKQHDLIDFTAFLCDRKRNSLAA